MTCGRLSIGEVGAHPRRSRSLLTEELSRTLLPETRAGFGASEDSDSDSGKEFCEPYSETLDLDGKCTADPISIPTVSCQLVTSRRKDLQKFVYRQQVLEMKRAAYAHFLQ
eukprot:gene6547-3198_t